MSSSYQNIVALVFASIVVLSMWYFDKETKNIHANIKIIQNMLKVVISNQQQHLNLQNSHTPGFLQEEQRQYIPYDVPNNELGDDESDHEEIESQNLQESEPLGTIIEENSEAPIEHSVEPPIEHEQIEEDEKPKKKRVYRKKNVISV